MPDRSHRRAVPALVALAATAATPAVAQSGGPNTTSLTHEVVLDGLQDPWDMAFLEDGTMLFTEKCLGLSVRMPDGTVTPLLGMGGAEGYPQTADDLFCEGQAGMMGVAFDPQFDDNRRIYVYATSNMSRAAHQPLDAVHGGRGLRRGVGPHRHRRRRALQDAGVRPPVRRARRAQRRAGALQPGGRLPLPDDG